MWEGEFISPYPISRLVENVGKQEYNLVKISKGGPAGQNSHHLRKTGRNLIMKMICNLHTHTFRCNHASGTEREYIENSIAGGIETIGFADHAPYVFPEGYYSGFRMRPDLQEDYVRTLLDLREEYKGKIDIKIGYEAEYYPKFFDKTVELFRRYPVDYLNLTGYIPASELIRRIF